MDVKERISALISDYHLAYKEYPRRITVSTEVARELEAILNAREVACNVSEFKPMRLREGQSMHFHGVLVVADLEPRYIMDVR